MRRSFVIVSALALLTLVGCGSNGDPFAGPAAPAAPKGSSLDDSDNVVAWANAASALGVYLNVYQPIAVADGAATFADPACPVTEDDGTTLSMTGGCTELGGTQWLGTASVTRSANGDRTLSLDGFGTQAKGKDPDTEQGEGSVRRLADDTHDFSVNLVHDAGLRTTIAYEGHVVGSYGLRTVWSGSGAVTRDGLAPPTGSVEVTTTAEVVDDTVCSGQPASGNTTIHNENDETVIVTYDGEVDCDGNQAASVSYNGVSKGKIKGIACALRPGLEGSRGAAAVALGLAFGLMLRRLPRARRTAS